MLAAYTDTGYWYEIMLTENWPAGRNEDPEGKQYHFHFRGYSVQFHIWDPNGEIHWNDETHLLGGERVDIRDGEKVNLAMQIRGDEVALGVYGRKVYQIKYPSYGARHFVGNNIKRMEDGRVQLHERGYFTGVALERYHTRYTWGGKKDHVYQFKMIVPHEIKHGTLEVHTRNDGTKESIYTLIDPDVNFSPSFSHDMQVVLFTGTPEEINILVRGEAFRRQSR